MREEQIREALVAAEVVLDHHPGYLTLDGISNVCRALLAMSEQLAAEQAKVKALQDTRAGKLLTKGKPFIVVAHDEPYFSDVYETIREHEKAKGTWTDKCEEEFLRVCKPVKGDG